jgi:hypothetical protein
MAVGFVFGLWLLLQWRIEQGDIYPAYSTYRADPMGAKALYESLQLLPGVKVERNSVPLSRWTEVRAQTYLVLGFSRDSWILDDETFLERLEQIASHGGRVILSLNAAALLPDDEPDRRGNASSGGRLAEETPIRRTAFWELVETQWGVKLGLETEDSDSAGDLEEPAVRVGAGSEGTLPESCPWKGTAGFHDLGEAWEVIYAKAGRPVVIQRNRGKGSLILVAGSYPFSNESLWRERSTQFLSWVLGRHRKITFDEVHLRMVKSPGIATLSRQYRLQGVVLVLIVVAGLFIWKNALGFPPVQTDPREERGNVVRGKDAASGYINLLRRNLAPHDLLPTMFEEWNRSFRRAAHVPVDLKRRMQSEIERERARPRNQRDPLETYRKLCLMLRENRRRFRPAEQGTATQSAPETEPEKPAG